MIAIVEAADPRVETLARRGVSPDEKVVASVKAIVADVRARGDVALREYVARFDRPAEPGAARRELELAGARWTSEAATVAPEVRRALERAASRIRAYHERQREESWSFEEEGVRLGVRVEPLARVGLYVPGGTARYPSSVLMTAVPARVAGVGELIMVTPGASPETLAAARIAGVDRVFELGGAQAVAALAYGTETVPRVDKIVGPGNAWVAEAKRLVFGDVDIDTVAGPSEVLIVADDSATPAWVAADLLAQAEHDVEAYPVCVVTSRAVADAIAAELARQVETLPRREIAAESIRRHGAIVVAADLREAIRFANRFAPEHLGLHVRDASRVSEMCRTAGAIFVGHHSPEAAGDYMAGANHVLPTGGAARYASPLGVWDFVKRTSIIEYTAEALAAQAEDINRLAEVEGLVGHGRSVLARGPGRP